MAAAAAVSATSNVQLRLAGRSLKKMDVFSESDPMIVVFLKSGRTRDQYIEIGRTEMLKNQANPDFATAINVEYFFEEVQTIKFCCYDVDKASGPLSAQDFIGEATATMGQMLGKLGGQYETNLMASGDAKSRGLLIVRSEEQKGNKNNLKFKITGHHLDKKDLFGKSDPYLEFSKLNALSTSVLFHRTEVVKKTLDPVWNPFSLSMAAFCGGDRSKAVMIDCYDWDADGSRDFIGHCEVTVRDLLASPEITVPLINPKKSEKKKYTNSGELKIRCEMEENYSFIEYLHSGFQLGFSVAVDFTASNGDPRQPNSLHHINPYSPNAYATAIRSVGAVIQDYDSDKLFPSVGFGAKFQATGDTYHCFSLTGNEQNPFCAGIDGILHAYTQTLSRVILHGPTYFGPIIQQATQIASRLDHCSYNVLLIITDGIINDMDQTIMNIIEASNYPLSIIIIGVGNADFSAMDQLDSDGKLLSLHGRTASRDIVQFVPMNKFLGPDSHYLLAKEVLAELPDQMVQFFKARNIKPLPPAT